VVSCRSELVRVDILFTEDRHQQIDDEIKGRALIVQEEDLNILSHLRYIQHESSQRKVINRRMNLTTFGSHSIKTHETRDSHSRSAGSDRRLHEGPNLVEL